MPFRANTTVTATDLTRSACKEKDADFASEAAPGSMKRHLGPHIGKSAGSVMRLQVFLLEAMPVVNANGDWFKMHVTFLDRHLTQTSLVDCSHAPFSHAGQTESGEQAS